MTDLQKDAIAATLSIALLAALFVGIPTDEGIIFGWFWKACDWMVSQ